MKRAVWEAFGAASEGHHVGVCQAGSRTRCAGTNRAPYSLCELTLKPRGIVVSLGRLELRGLPLGGGSPWVWGGVCIL